MTKLQFFNAFCAGWGALATVNNVIEGDALVASLSAALCIANTAVAFAGNRP
jgi:hypothetical protein